MERRLKFYGWGREGEGLDEAERARVFRFLAEKLGVEPRAAAPPPQASEIALREPRISRARLARPRPDPRSVRAPPPHLRQVVP